MNIKTIGIFAILAVLAVGPTCAEEDSYEDADVVEYSEYEVFDDIENLIDEELSDEVVTESDNSEIVVDNSAVVEVPAPRTVASRLSCDEINTRVAELQVDVKSYPELKTDLEYMLSRQRNQCAPRAARRPVHNYKNVNPVVDVEVPEVEISTEPSEPEKTPEEVAAQAAAAEAARQAQITENRAKGLCDDGEKPNQYGCCDGEVFKQVEHLNFACCPAEGDCHQPRKK